MDKFDIVYFDIYHSTIGEVLGPDLKPVIGPLWEWGIVDREGLLHDSSSTLRGAIWKCCKLNNKRITYDQIPNNIQAKAFNIGLFQKSHVPGSEFLPKSNKSNQLTLLPVFSWQQLLEDEIQKRKRRSNK